MMKKKKLSDRQRFILNFIREYMQEHGYAPSIREIKGEVESAGLVRTASGNTSTSVVDYNLRALEEAGYIRRDRNKSRAIELTDCQWPQPQSPAFLHDPRRTNTHRRRYAYPRARRNPHGYGHRGPG